MAPELADSFCSPAEDEGDSAAFSINVIFIESRVLQPVMAKSSWPPIGVTIAFLHTYSYEGTNPRVAVFLKYAGHDDNRDVFSRPIFWTRSTWAVKILFTADWRLEAHVDYHGMGTNRRAYLPAALCRTDPAVRRPHPVARAEPGTALHMAHKAGSRRPLGRHQPFYFTRLRPLPRLSLDYAPSTILPHKPTESAAACLASPLFVHPGAGSLVWRQHT